MNISALLTLLRNTLDDELIGGSDADTKYTTDQLTTWLSEAENEAARRSRLLYESTTTALTNVSITAETDEYTISDKWIWLTNVRISTGVRPLKPTTEERLDRSGLQWRDETGVPTQYIHRLGYIRLVYNPSADATLYLSGYRLPLYPMRNDPDHATSTAYVSGDYVNDGASNYYLCTTGGTSGGTTPTWDTTEGNTTADGTVVWTCMGQYATEPEIPSHHHRYLTDWAAFLAYTSDDRDLADPGSAKRHYDLFQLRFGPPVSAALEQVWRRYVPMKAVGGPV